MDPVSPDQSNIDIVGYLVVQLTDFEAFEELSATLGGRWIAFVRVGTAWRLYPDACGSRTVFFVRTPAGELSLGSQPNLLAKFSGAGKDPDIERRFRQPEHGADSWPLTLTPFRGVRQLLPNHYLDLASGAMVRFWPTVPLQVEDVERALATAGEILHGTINSMAGRGQTALALTGGLDSRTLLACAKGIRDQLSLVRVTGYHLPFYDSIIPRKLSKRLKMRLHIIPSRPAPHDILDLVAENTGGMWWDPADYMICSFRHIDCDFLLLGQVSEVTRCFYYSDGNHPESVTPQFLAKIAGYKSNPLAIEEFSRWLDGVPRTAQPYMLDLLYWEHRVGNWAAMLATTFDTFFEPIFPFNCRRLLQTILSLPVEYRAAPYKFHRMLYSRAEPLIANIEINSSLLDKLVGSHWRLRRAVKNYRKKSSGF